MSAGSEVPGDSGAALLGTGGTTPRRRRHPRRPDRARLAAVLVGAATTVLLGGWFGLLAGVVAGAGSDGWLRRLEPAAARRSREAEAADLPLAADLMAAVLRAGAPTERAAGTVAEALGGPLGERLHRVARTLRLGGTAEEAWAHLGRSDGARRLAGSAVRSAGSGAALSGTLSRLAEDLRADRAAYAETAARRAGVLVVLPMGLCFLPAFILAGLVPVIVAVLGDVL
ncbi:type II secretion system F family protein [Plantactinospora siamensis]|uniref:Type II secretion system F family protein n=1 Tax=Plantactinospora siamensis TaxID=555372 RepID=A0ABV6NWN7_9ACTN